jgi:hypothetical protein
MRGPRLPWPADLSPPFQKRLNVVQTLTHRCAVPPLPVGEGCFPKKFGPSPLFGRGWREATGEGWSPIVLKRSIKFTDTTLGANLSSKSLSTVYGLLSTPYLP